MIGTVVSKTFLTIYLTSVDVEGHMKNFRVIANNFPVKLFNYHLCFKDIQENLFGSCNEDPSFYVSLNKRPDLHEFSSKHLVS